MSFGHTLKRSNLLFFSPRLRCGLDLSPAFSTLEIVLNNQWKYGKHHLIGWSLHQLRPSYAQNQIGLLSSNPSDPHFSCFSSLYSYQEVLFPFHTWGRFVMKLPILCCKIKSHIFFAFILVFLVIYFICFFFFFFPRTTGCWRSQDTDHKRFIFCLPSEVVQNDQISRDFP